MARRDHSVDELDKKLKSKTTEPQFVDVLIAELIDLQLLNDERFVGFFVDNRLRQGLGPKRIALALKDKGIEAELISEQLNLKAGDWSSVLAKTWSKRFKQKPKDRKAYLQQARYLQYRGFSPDQINSFIREIDDEE